MKNKIRILHIDDSLNGSKIVKELLQKERDEFELIETNDPIEFELHLDKSDFDLVLSDFDNRGFEGLKVLQTVKAKKPKVPVIIVTGNGSEEIAVEAMKLGAADYVVKTDKKFKNLTPIIKKVIEDTKAHEAHEAVLIELRSSEERFRLLFDNNLDGVLLTVPNGDILQINAAGCKIFGRTEEEILKTGRSGIIDTTDPRLALALEERKHTGKFRGVLTGLRGNGEPFPIEISSALFFDSNGNQRSSMIVRDITEKNLANELLVASETRYRRLFESAKDGILILDAETGMIVDVNPFLVELLGYSAKQFHEKKIWEIGVFSNILANMEKFLELQQKGYVHYSDLPLLTADGREVSVEFVSNVYDVNHKKVIQCNIRDITVRKKAEKEKQEIEKMFRLVMENSADAIFLADQKGNYVYSNKAVTEMLGFSEEEILKKSITDLTPHNKSEQYFQLFHEIIKTGKGFAEIELLKSDGKYISVDLNSVLLPNGLVYGSCRDITLRKEAENLLIQKSQEIEMQNEEYYQLNEELEQLNEELTNSKERAEESDRLKTAFLQNLSHEIRTPMNGILGFAELLSNPALSGEKHIEFLKIIEQSGARMLNIINDIVNISKIETGEIALEINTTNVNYILKNMYTFFKPEANKKGLDLSYNAELPDEFSLIKTDETKLSQILSNLIKNALKFTKTGNINYGYRCNNNYLEFYITDTGIGIDTDKQNVIFNRFRQIDMSRTRGYEGAGLGLAISKAYIEKLGGTIWVKSELGKGATFFFNIPYKFEEEKQYKSPADVKLSVGKLPANILLTDDDEASLFLLKEMFTGEKVNLFFANNGQEAVKTVRVTHNIQIVLMDIKMPVMDGLEATRLIKILKPGLPVIAQSAYAFETDRTNAITAGCDDFINKPIRKMELFEAINKQLAKYYDEGVVV